MIRIESSSWSLPIRPPAKRLWTPRDRSTRARGNTRKPGVGQDRNLFAE